MRIRGAKADLEEMGEETDGLADSSSKMREEIKALSGVDIMADEDTFKSTADIIKELGAAYNNMTDVSQAALLEKIAGKNRASTVEGLLQNYEIIDEVIKSAENAEGSALEENEKRLQSIEGHIQLFTNSVQEFWFNLISSDTVKFIVDAATKIMNALAGIVDVTGELGTLGLLGAGFLGLKNLDSKVLGNKGSGILSALLGIDSIKDIVKAIKDLFKGETVTEAVEEAVGGKTGKSSNLFTGILEGFKGVKKGAVDASKAMGTVKTLGGTTFDTLKSGAGAFISTLTSSIGTLGTIGLAIGAVAAALGIAYAAFDKYNLSAEEAQEATDSMMDSFESAKSEADKNAQSIASLKDEYASLMSGVNTENNMNLTLSTEDYERYLQLNNEIADMYPELVKGYDAQSNAILDLKGNVESLTAASEDAQRAAYALAFTGSGDIENSGFNAVLKSYDSQTTSTGKWYENIGEKIQNLFTGDKEVGIEISYEDAIKELEKFQVISQKKLSQLSGTGNVEDKDLSTGAMDMIAVATALGMEMNEFVEAYEDEEKLLQLQKQVTTVINQYQDTMNAALADMQTAAEGYLKGVEYADGTLQSGYDRLSENQQNLASLIVTNMSFDDADAINSQADLQTYVDGIVETVSRHGQELEGAYNKINEILQSPEGVTTESLKGIAEQIELISSRTGIAGEDLEKMFGIDSFKETERTFKDLNDEIAKTQKETDELDNYTKDFNNTQKQAWLTAVKGCTSAQEAIQSYEEYMLNATAATSDGIYNVIDAINEADSAYNRVQNVQSDETPDFGDTYASMYEMYQRGAELAKSGDVGTEEFKSIAAMFSPSGAEDIDNWNENVSKIKRYFQEDSNKGALNFLKDLEKHDFAQYNEETKSWTYTMDDLAEAAQELNIGFEPFMAMLDMLEGKGFYNDFFETEADGMAHLSDLTNQLAEAEAELYELEQNDPNNKSAIKAKEEEIATLKQRIEDTTTSLDKLLNKSVEDRIDESKKNEKSMKSIIDSYNANYSKLNDAGRKQWQNEIMAAAEQYGFTVTVNGEGKLDLDTTQTVKEAKEEVENTSFKGTVDLTARPQVSGETMSDAGYNVDADATATVHSIGYSNEAGDKTVLVSPILPDGTVLEEGKLEEYANKILAGEEIDQNILIRSFEGEDSINQSNLYAEALHKVQDAYYLGDEAQKESLNSLKQYTDEQLKAINLYDNQSSEMEDALLSLMDSLGVTHVEAEQFINVLADMGLVSKPLSEMDLSKLDELKTKASESKDVVQDLVNQFGDEAVPLNLDTDDVDSINAQIRLVKASIGTLKDENGNITLETEGAQECIDVLSYLNSLKAEVTGKVLMSVDTSKLDGDVQTVITKLQEFHEAYNELQNLNDLKASGVDVDTTAAQEKVDNLTTELENLPDGQAEILADIVPDPSSASKIEESISSLTEGTLISIGVDTSAIDGYVAPDQTATVKYEKDTTEIDNYDPEDLTRTVTFNKSTTKVDNWISNLKNTTLTKTVTFKAAGDDMNGDGDPGWATGTAYIPSSAHADGTVMSMWNNYRSSIGAYAQGADWALPRNENALVNEVGTESIVRSGRWFPIPGGAHVEQLKKGDIIFNAKQTEELTRTGRVISGGGHGRVARADGTAYNMLNAHAGGTAISGMSAYSGIGSGGGSLYDPSGSSSSSKSSSKSNSNNNSNSNATEEAEEFEETFDWIERRIKDIERDIENLDRTVSAAYKSWSERNTALTDEIELVNEEIDVQLQAYQRYMQEANSVGLSDKYKKLVQEGKIDIETIKDEDLAEKIKEYQDYLDKANEAQDEAENLKDRLAELAKTRFDGVVTQYENILSSVEHRIELIEGSIDRIETEGYLVSEKMYHEIAKSQKESLATLQQEREALVSALATAMEEGNIEKYSEDWYELVGQIQDVEKEISSLNSDIAETSNKIQEVQWNLFDMLQEMKGTVQSESDWLIDLMSNDKMFNEDDASITDQGQATLGLHAVNYNAYMSQADDYAKEIEKLNKEIALDPYNVTLLERRQELIDAQREMIQSAEDEKQAIKDLVSDGYDTFLSVMDEAIEKRKEMLQTTKDMYDYEKNVAEQTKEIANLQKQLNAYSGDTSEESRATIQQLKVSLEEAQQNLEETEYDKYISDQEQMLDTLRDETEQWISARLDNIDLLIGGVIESTNANAESIKTTLETEVSDVGTTLSDAMTAIWTTDGEAKEVVSYYGDSFSSALTTTNSTLEAIRKYLAKMVGDSDDQADQEVEDANNQLENLEQPKQEEPKKEEPKKENPTTTGDGVPKVGDKVTFASGKYYYSSDGISPTGNKNLGKQVYITSVNNASWAKKKYHISTGNKLGSGDLGWVSLDQLKGYSTGGLIDYDGFAAVHGGKKPELVLNAKDTENFIELKDTLRMLSSEDLSALREAVSLTVPTFASMNNLHTTPLSPFTGNQSVSIEIGDIQMYGVNDPETFAVQLKHALQTNKAVKNIIQADTLGVMAGKNGLTKFKY